MTLANTPELCARNGGSWLAADLSEYIPLKGVALALLDGKYIDIVSSSCVLVDTLISNVDPNAPEENVNILKIIPNTGFLFIINRNYSIQMWDTSTASNPSIYTHKWTSTVNTYNVVIGSYHFNKLLVGYEPLDLTIKPSLQFWDIPTKTFQSSISRDPDDMAPWTGWG